VAALGALVLHAATLTNFLYTHDGWNDVLLGERILAGGLPWTENVLRLTPNLTFGLRALVEPLSPLWMPVWHAPMLLGHALNAALVVVLSARLGMRTFQAVAAGLLLAFAPLLAHAVEWVGGTYDVLATLGVLGACLGVLDRRWWLVGLAGLLALTSKEGAFGVVGIAGLCVMAVEGLPRGRPAMLALAKRLSLLVILTVLVGGFRLAQIQNAPSDAMAGRSVTFDALGLLTSGPTGIGLALSAPVSELVDLDPRSAEAVGWGAAALLLMAAGLRRSWPTLCLALAAGVALIPVSLIAMGAEEMVDNARYLYLSAAFLAPVIPLLLGDSVPARIILGGLVAVAGVHGADRVGRSLEVTNPAAVVAEQVLAQPAGSAVVVLTGLYDEPTARFLMSRWLRSRGVRARYVMRGTGVVYSRRAQGAEDAAQAYFGPGIERFDPQSVGSAHVLLQRPEKATVEKVQLPARAAGGWVDVPVALTPAPPEDADDDVLRIEAGRRCFADRRIGPIGAATLRPRALQAVGPGPATGLELHVSAKTASRARYGAGYHDRWVAVFLGDEVLSAEVPIDGRPARIELDLSWDPVAMNTARLGFIPLSYPGEITFNRLRVRR
jgi:hypothetical protein